MEVFDPLGCPASAAATAPVARRGRAGAPPEERKLIYLTILPPPSPWGGRYLFPPRGRDNYLPRPPPPPPFLLTPVVWWMNSPSLPLGL